ncbi:hypothetical protein [Occultella gossypii]|uniref:UDP-N-acetylglucosamine kinase n=1 Tax=Occultella gossypii TaxID=2800820 RepID=A0ABS7SGS2_9MICO|nr:hypothetical protein [Occultella gossypii]MBZ2199402.1 hypothetical protein [Occultella gossypii]
MNATDSPMIWIGGAPGSGKSTIARSIAHANDLPLHPIDRWTYVHAALRPTRPLAEELAKGPASAAAAFVTTARERLRLALRDVAGRRLGGVPALMEGPQLLPEMADALAVGHAVWLIPDSEQTRSARLARLDRVDDLGARRLLESLLQRDEVLAERIRAQARDMNRPVVEVAAEPDWPEIRNAVAAALAPALASTARLPHGEGLMRQRRFENDAAAEQITLWVAAEDVTPDPVFDFACECGGSGCTLAWSGTVSDYRRRASVGPTLAEPHMIG